MPTTEARERAAQLWCLPQFSNREMDAEFAEAIAEALTEFRNAGVEAVASHLDEEGEHELASGSSTLKREA